MSLKIAFVGAGSLGFTRTLVHDLLAVPEFRTATFALNDIHPRNLAMVTKILERDIAANGLSARIESTTDRRAAFEGASYVVNSSRIGGLDAFQLDIDIPLKYGVDQCVGDTLCAGGIFYGQRGIAAMLEFCRDIREVALPNALLLNYGNPNAMLTWAANEHGEVDCVGLCHGVQGGHWQITKVIESLVNGTKKPGSKGYREIAVQEVDIICAGINHQTWYTQVLFEGEDWTHRLLEGFERHPQFSQTEKVRIDILRRFGYYSTESNGHLSEYVPWYRKRKGETKNWISTESWIHGETGGYLRVCTEGRNWFDTEFPKLLADKPWQLEGYKRSLEHGSYLIESLETGRIYRGHLNVPNCQRTISNLPEDCIVEVPCYVDRNGISVPSVGDLPPGCAAVCAQSVGVQRLAVLAALEGDVELLKQAMMLDPLVGAVCTPPEISQMTDEMLVAQARWLPQYAHALPAARKRLKSEPALGTWTWTGAARKPVATTAKPKASTRKASQKLVRAQPKG